MKEALLLLPGGVVLQTSKNHGELCFTPRVPEGCEPEAASLGSTINSHNNYHHHKMEFSQQQMRRAANLIKDCQQPAAVLIHFFCEIAADVGFQPFRRRANNTLTAL